MKRRREKGGKNVEDKGREGKEKGRKGIENENGEVQG
jgi:hypothetical protein